MNPISSLVLKAIAVVVVLAGLLLAFKAYIDH